MRITAVCGKPCRPVEVAGVLVGALALVTVGVSRGDWCPVLVHALDCWIWRPDKLLVRLKAAHENEPKARLLCLVVTVGDLLNTQID